MRIERSVLCGVDPVYCSVPPAWKSRPVCPAGMETYRGIADPVAEVTAIHLRNRKERSHIQDSTGENGYAGIAAGWSGRRIPVKMPAPVFMRAMCAPLESAQRESKAIVAGVSAGECQGARAALLKWVRLKRSR